MELMDKPTRIHAFLFVLLGGKQLWAVMDLVNWLTSCSCCHVCSRRFRVVDGSALDMEAPERGEMRREKKGIWIRALLAAIREMVGPGG